MQPYSYARADCLQPEIHRCGGSMTLFVVRSLRRGNLLRARRRYPHHYNNRAHDEGHSRKSASSQFDGRPQLSMVERRRWMLRAQPGVRSIAQLEDSGEHAQLDLHLMGEQV
jgi:hypothetical protein